MLNELNANLALLIQQTQHNAYYLGIILLVLYGVLLITTLIPGFFYLGIRPRHLLGLLGIFFAPFLHLNFNHLFFNSIPLIILSNFILINGLDYFLLVSLSITLISGLLVWCFAKPGIHIGASAVITGYWGLLVSNIYHQETLMSVMLGFVCVYYFAGIFLGVFPREKGVSWEGHLFGLLAGILTSYLVV